MFEKILKAYFKTFDNEDVELGMEVIKVDEILMIHQLVDQTTL